MHVLMPALMIFMPTFVNVCMYDNVFTFMQARVQMCILYACMQCMLCMHICMRDHACTLGGMPHTVYLRQLYAVEVLHDTFQMARGLAKLGFVFLHVSREMTCEEAWQRGMQLERAADSPHLLPNSNTSSQDP